MPLAIAKRCSSNSSFSLDETRPCSDSMWFLTSAIVVSAFGLPIILQRASVVSIFSSYDRISINNLINLIKIMASSMGFVLAANVVVFATITTYFLTFGSDDNYGFA